MAWSTKTNGTQLTAITTTEKYHEKVTLNPGETAHCTLEFGSGGTTDGILWSVYTTLDDTTEDWDGIPIQQVGLPNGDENKRAAIIVADVYAFRIGAAREGSTDTQTSDFSYRKNGVSI